MHHVGSFVWSSHYSKGWMQFQLYTPGHLTIYSNDTLPPPNLRSSHLNVTITLKMAATCSSEMKQHNALIFITYNFFLELLFRTKSVKTSRAKRNTATQTGNLRSGMKLGNTESENSPLPSFHSFTPPRETP